jgi:hypothetical protein
MMAHRLVDRHLGMMDQPGGEQAVNHCSRTNNWELIPSSDIEDGINKS